MRIIQNFFKCFPSEKVDLSVISEHNFTVTEDIYQWENNL